jgi:hypothetical protein
VNIALKSGIYCALMGFAAACSHDSTRRPAETASAEVGSAPDTARSAAESIAEARCAREDRCTNIGSEKKYSTTQDCLARVRDDWKDDLNARECPGGVKRTELEECLTAIRNEECSSPFESLSRMTQCTAGQICAK